MAALSEIFLESPGSDCVASVRAVEPITGRIPPQGGIRRGRSWTAAEHMIEQPHGVGDIQGLVIVDVRGVSAGKLRSPEEMEDDLHRVADIDPAISV